MSSPRFSRALRRFLRLVFLPAAAVALPAARAQDSQEYERAPINYSATAPHDAVAPLLQRIARGEITLRGSDRDIVHTLLDALQVPAESQLLVFSRTSLQARLIRPATPRALYFSDSVYVGWVPGGLVEVAAIDPELGPVFYAFNPREARDAHGNFERDASCLRCHGGTFVRDIPGVFARSVFPSDRGEPLLQHGTELVDDETPFERRWGGWYVTGYTGTQNHRGNTFAREGDRLDFPPNEQRPMELSGELDTSRYLTATSDVVALLVFEHQLAMHNAITSAGQRARRMLDYQRSLQKAFHEPETDEPAYDSVKSVVASATQDVLDRLLFRNAAPLPEGVKGSDAFRRAFAAGARPDRAGHALKDLSLQGRLFANRCSFLIYSESFRVLPAPLKNRIFDRLYAVLRGEDASGRYAYLEPEERRRILDILLATHPEAARHFEKLAQRATTDAPTIPAR